MIHSRFPNHPTFETPTMYTIHCHDLVTLAQTCAELVRQGVTFEARTDSMIVVLLGGF